MSEVKQSLHTRFTSWWQSYEIMSRGKMQIAQDAYVQGASDFDAQRLHADTAEDDALSQYAKRVAAVEELAAAEQRIAELAAVKQALDATRDALEATQYANAELTSKLSERDQLFHALTHSPHAVAVPLELWKQIKVFAAALNPNPEAESQRCEPCQGFGAISTGITEAPSTICNKCDGTGRKA